MTDPVPPRAVGWWRRPRVWQTVAVVFGVIDGVATIVTPSYSAGDRSSLTLAQEHGWATAIAVAVIPLVLAVLPLRFHEARAYASMSVLAAGLLAIFFLVAIFVIGFIHLPMLVCLVIAAIIAARKELTRFDY
jgi:hypothetical protein